MQFIAHRAEGWSAMPASFLASLTKILRAGALVVEPRQQSDPASHVGGEYAVAVLRRIEQLILFGLLPRGLRLLLLVPQSDEPIGVAPARRLILELALAVGIGFR